MKKTLLLLMLGSVFCVNAQEVIWSDDFDDEDISDWIVEDADADGFNWGDMFTVNTNGGVPVTPVSLISRSWQGDALFPDNWVISPEIDLTNVTGPISLNWVVQCAAAAWSLEKYSVYAGTEQSVDGLVGSTVVFTEVYPGGTSGASLSRSLDLTSLAGQVVYIAFRHYDCTDQDFISIDDVEVTGTLLGTDSFFTSNFRMYPNPSSSVINLSSSTTQIQSAQLTDINGRVVKNVSLNGVSEAQINISDLNTGMYFLKVQSDRGTGTAKVMKN